MTSAEEMMSQMQLQMQAQMEQMQKSFQVVIKSFGKAEIQDNKN